MTMTMTMNTIFYRVLILAGIALLVLANLSQSAFAVELEQPKWSDCIAMDEVIESDDREYVREYGDVGIVKKVAKFQNTCKESWTVKYFYHGYPTPYYEQVLEPGESFILSYVEEHRKAQGDIGQPSIAVIGELYLKGCPSTDDTLLEVNSRDALYDFQCAWR